MPMFITQGRFTQDAIKGMLAHPEDRADAVRKLFSQSGGKLIAYYLTFGDYDFLVVSEGPDEGVAVSTLVTTASGEVSDLKTCLAVPSTDMKKTLETAGRIAASFAPAAAMR